MKGDQKNQGIVRFLATYGCISTGILYSAIGVFAMLSFLKLKRGGADESSLFVFLNEYIIGEGFTWLIMLGMVSYVAWRIYETVADPYQYGKDARGIAKRTGIAWSSIADALIAYSAIQALFNLGAGSKDGQPEQQRQMASEVLQESYGAWMMVAIGVIVCMTSVVQIIYVVSKAYMERLDIGHLRKGMQKAIHVVAWYGYLARGIILGITGFFLIKAGLNENASLVVNTDKAFDFIGDHVGHIYFIIVAFGTISYGLFMFILGYFYNTDAG